MSIDTGLSLVYNSNFPTPNINQSSQQFRDNFSIIKSAIENIQGMTSNANTSIFTISASVSSGGALLLSSGFTGNAFSLPSGTITNSNLVAGLIQYKSSTMQLYDGSNWNIVVTNSTSAPLFFNSVTIAGRLSLSYVPTANTDVIQLSYLNSAIGTLQNYVNSVVVSIGANAIANSISSEQNARIVANSILANSIAVETAARIAGDSTLSNSIITLTATLNANAIAETNARTLADTALSNSISNETNARVIANSTLANSISDLNTTFTANLSAETNARVLANSVLANSIAMVANNIQLGGTVGGTISLNLLLLQISQPNTAAGVRAALDSFMSNNALSVLLFDDGVYSPHWTGTMTDGQHKTIRGSANSVLRVNQLSPVISVDAPPVWIDNVVSTHTVLDASFSDDGTYVTDNDASTITFANTHAVSQRQFMKIISEDDIPNARHNGSLHRKEGEFFVASLTANSNTITSTSPFRGSYTTGIRAAAIPNCSFNIEGFTLDANSALANTGNSAFSAIQLSGMVRPVVKNLRSNYQIGTAVQFGGCIHALADNISVDGGVDIPFASQYAYGIFDAASEGTTIVNSSFKNVLSGTDAGGYDAASYDSPWKYGRTRGHKVIGCSAMGCQSAGFDTQNEVDGGIITACSVNGGYAGANAVGSGITIRGKNVIVDHCYIENCKTGVIISTSQGGILDSVIVKKSYLYGVALNSPNTTANANVNCIIRDSNFEIVPYNVNASVITTSLTAGNAALEFQGKNVFSVSGAIDLKNVLSIGSTTITGSALTIDLTGMTQPQASVVSSNQVSVGAGYSLFDVLTVVGGTNTVTAQFTVSSVGPAGIITGYSISRSGTYTALPSNPVSVTGGTGTGATFQVFGSNGTTVYYQQNYDTSPWTSEGPKVYAGNNLVASMWNGALDGSNDPFTNNHTFLNTYYEGVYDIVGAYSGSIFSVNSHWPNLKYSGTKLVSGIASRTSAMAVTVTGAGVMPGTNLLDNVVYWSLQGNNYAGCTPGNPPFSSMPDHVQGTLRNDSNGVVTFASPSISIPPKQAATFKKSDNGTMVLVAKTWTTPTALAGTKTSDYATNTSNVGGLQQVKYTGNTNVISLFNTAVPGDRIDFQNQGVAWIFAPQAAVVTAGSGYSSSDSLTATNGSTIKVTSVSNSGAVLAATVTSQSGNALSNPTTVTGGGGTGATFNMAGLTAADGSFPPLFSHSGAAGTSCYALCLSNADGVSALWTIGGTVAS